MIRNENSDSKRSVSDAMNCPATGVDGVIAAQAQARRKHVKIFEDYIWNTVQNKFRKLYLDNGYAVPLDKLKALEREYRQKKDDCKSPMKKKLKSNSPHEATRQQTSPIPKGGLSTAEIQHVRGLKKSDIVAKLEAVGGEYKKKWTKPVLVEKYLQVLTEIKHPPAKTVPSDNNNFLEKEIAAITISSETDIEENFPGRPVSKGNNVIESAHATTQETLPPIGREESAMLIGSGSGDRIQHPSQGIVRRAIEATEQKVAANELARGTASATKAPSTLGRKFGAESNLLSTPADASALKKDPELLVKGDLISFDVNHSVKASTVESHDNRSEFAVIKRTLLESNIQSVETLGPPPTASISSTSNVVVDSLKSNLNPPPQPYKDTEIQPNFGIVSKQSIISGNRSVLTTPALNGTVFPGTMPGASEAMKASKEARMARAAELKAASKYLKIPLQKSVLSSGIVHEIQTSSNSRDRLAEMRAKHQREACLQPTSLRLASKTPPVVSISVKSQPSRSPPPSDIKIAVLVSTIESHRHRSPTPSKDKHKAKVDIENSFTNYEMTDNEYDSQSDDESEASQNNKNKRVPDWARSFNLMHDLERQYSRKFDIDPDELFGEVTTCDLAAIFNKKSKRYIRRNSSGEWSAHRVTSAEKRSYKLAVM